MEATATYSVVSWYAEGQISASSSQGWGGVHLEDDTIAGDILFFCRPAFGAA